MKKTSGTYISFDGTNSTVKVLLKDGIRRIEKAAKGDSQVYKIARMIFEQVA